MSGAEWEGTVEEDPEGVFAPFPGETRAQACKRWALEDEVEEDPARASREAHMIAALRDEELFAAELSRRSIESLPTAVRRLYRKSPNNPRLRALYDQMTAELFARATDILRGALLPATEEMVSLIDSGDPAVRLRAATYILERMMGKTPEVLNVTQDKPFQVVLERIVTGPRIAAERVSGLEDPEGPLDAEIVAESDSGPGTAVVKSEPAYKRVARRAQRRKTD